MTSGQVDRARRRGSRPRSAPQQPLCQGPMNGIFGDGAWQEV